MAKFAPLAALAALLAGGLVAPAHAADAAMPSFPAATDDGAAMVWLRKNTSLGVGRFVVFNPDNVLVVLTDEVSTRAPNIHRVSFRQEAIKLDFVARTGGRSMRGSGEIDCATGSFRAETVELFSGSDLRGERINGEGPDAVGRVPRAGSAPAIAASQVCGGDPSALAPLANISRRVAAAPARPSAAPIADPTPIPPPAPAPVPPPVPAPAAAPVPTPAPPRHPAPPKPAPPVPAPVTAPAPPSPAAAPEEVLAQIGAFGTREAAERAWSRLAETFPDLMAGKSLRIDPVTVNGNQMFRSAISGFAGQTGAAALCQRLMASSESCFVRKAP
jgi:hypothetical protein